jgi:hypothetical protein
MARDRDTTLFTASTSTSAVNYTVINAVGNTILGPRVAQLATVYSRYRVKRITLDLPPLGVNNGDYAVGFLDDVGGEGGISDLPTTIRGVASLRQSMVVFGSTTIIRRLTWTPVDPSKWYYVDPPVTGDQRLSFPATLCVSPNADTGSLSVNFRVTYDIEFEGQSTTA